VVSHKGTPTPLSIGSDLLIGLLAGTFLYVGLGGQ